MPCMDAPKRGCRALFCTSIPIIEDRLPRNVLGLAVFILGLGVFMVKIDQLQAGSFACHGMDVVGNQTRNCFATDLPAPGSLHGADPVPSNDLARRQPDALLQWCSLPRKPEWTCWDTAGTSACSLEMPWVPHDPHLHLVQRLAFPAQFTAAPEQAEKKRIQPPNEAPQAKRRDSRWKRTSR